MNKTTKNNNDVVIIELDRPRELRFRHKAMKKMLAMTGKSVEDMEKEDQDLNLEELELIFFYGLEKDAKENGETLTLEMMEDILDYAPSYEYMMEKLQEAFAKSSGSFMGNDQPVKAIPPNQNRRK